MLRPSKRTKASHDDVANVVSSSTVIQPISQGKKSLIILPSELLLEVVSYFPDIDIDIIQDCRQTLPASFRERFNALRALSQTCRELRSVVLPLAWERLEACTTAGHPTQFFKECGKTLERKCKGLLESDHLLPHVRYVLQYLSKYIPPTPTLELSPLL